MPKAKQEIVEFYEGIYMGFLDLNTSILVLDGRSNLEMLAMLRDYEDIRFMTPGGRLKRTGNVGELRKNLKKWEKVYTSYPIYAQDMMSRGKNPQPDPNPHHRG